MGGDDSFWASCLRELRLFAVNHIGERLAALSSLDDSARRLVDEEMKMLGAHRDGLQNRVDNLLWLERRRSTAAVVTVWLKMVATLEKEVKDFDRCLIGRKTTGGGEASGSARNKADSLQDGDRGGCNCGLCAHINQCCCGLCSWLKLSGGHLCVRLRLSCQVAGLMGRVRRLREEGESIRAMPDEQLYAMSDGGIRTGEVHLVGASADDALQRSREFLYGGTEGGILGICGMGGVGKTVLLEQIRYEYNQTRQSSELPPIWAEVTPEQLLEQPSCTNMVNIQSLRDTIGGQLQPKPPSEAGWNAQSLRAALSRGRCLLLLENVWETLDLELIGIPRDKCKIVVTTRSDNVVTGMYAERVKLDRLLHDEDLILFRHHLNNDRLLDANEHHAGLIVKECHGLPLALKIMAAVMRTKTGNRDWIDTLEGLRDPRRRFHNMGGEGERSVFRVLSYSYNQLRAEWQPCLLYCSLFGNNMDMGREDLVDYWIGEGFLDSDVVGASDDTETARRKGRSVINELVSRYLLECSSGNEEGKVKMHSLIRDMAIKIAAEKFLVYPISTTRRGKEDEDWGKAERISMMGSNASNLPRRNCPNLKTLLLNNCRLLKTIPTEFFQQTPALRLLDLSNSGIKVIPGGITNLKQLRHLNLSHTNIAHLPVEVGELENLRHLDLSSTLELETIPHKAISGLSRLRRLNMFKSKYQRWVWDARDEGRGVSLGDLESLGGLESLGDLETLSEESELEELALNINDHDSFKDLVRSRLARSTVCLYLEGFRGLAPDTSFHSLMSLRELYLTNVLDLERLVLERRWFLNLEVLHLSSLSVAAIELSDHEEPAGDDICRLSRVEVSNCRNLQDLSWVKHLVRLETLCVRDCSDLKVVIAADDGGRGGECCCFECLRVITLASLPNLESFCGYRMRMKVDPNLSINGCDKLTGELRYRDAVGQEKVIRYQDCQRQIP